MDLFFLAIFIKGVVKSVLNMSWMFSFSFPSIGLDLLQSWNRQIELMKLLNAMQLKYSASVVLQKGARSHVQ